MLNIMTFIEDVKKNVAVDVYPYFFPMDVSDECLVVNFNEVLGKRGTVNTMTCTFLARTNHPEQSLAICENIIRAYDRKTNLFFDNVQIILMRAKQEAGQFRGVDEQGRYVFGVDVEIISTRTDVLN